MKGIRADQQTNQKEVEELQNWCLLQHDHVWKYPFKEIIPKVKLSILDGVLTSEEIDDILWLCEGYTNTNPYFNVITADIQELHGVLQGILSDNQITECEIKALKLWLEDHAHLESTYPYDEVYALIVGLLQDGQVDKEEERLLKAFFSDFVDTAASVNIHSEEMMQLRREMSIQGICALGPNIVILEKMFCFTGESSRIKRSEIGEIVKSRGGRFQDNVTNETNYLVVGDNGNPCWAFSCYGRKIEKAVKLRKQGKSIVIAHEIDFWDVLN